jgi:hypothetical protein
MGWTQDSFSGTIDGHRIVVEARSGPWAARFALKVDDEVQDMIKAVTGDHWLEGALPGGADGGERRFRVRVNLKAAGLGGETYWIEIDGEETKLGEGFIV